jgi:hypothetical protein
MQSRDCKFTRGLSVRHSERSAAESKNPVKLCEGSSAGSLDFARDDNQVCGKEKRPRRFPRALLISIWKTTLSLRPCRSRSSRFLAFNDSRRLRQYYFAHDHPITHCCVINGSWGVWTDCRPSDNTTFRINHSRVLGIVVTHGRGTRRCSEHEVIRVGCVGDDIARSAGGRLLGGGRTRYGVCACCSCCRLRKRYTQRCRANQACCQYFG